LGPGNEERSPHFGARAGRVEQHQRGLGPLEIVEPGERFEPPPKRGVSGRIGDALAPVPELGWGFAEPAEHVGTASGTGGSRNGLGSHARSTNASRSKNGAGRRSLLSMVSISGWIFARYGAQPGSCRIAARQLSRSPRL